MDIRESLEAAWDKGEPDVPGDEPQTPAPEPIAAPEPRTAEAGGAAEPVGEPKGGEREAGRDAAGKFTKVAEPKAPPANGRPGKTLQTPATQQAPASKPGEAASVKAPKSLSPAVREQWDKLPEVVRNEWTKREADVAKAIGGSVQNAEYRKQMDAVVGPYSAMIQAEGGTIHGTVGSLLQTAAALRTAPASHKAGIVASIISQFGIDPAMVAEHLQGGVPQGQGQPQGFDPGQFRSQLLQDFQQLQQHQQGQALQQHYSSKWEEFAGSHEFSGDVSETMRGLITAGIANDYEDAYNKAVALTPGIKEIIAQREEAQRSQSNRDSTQRARAASIGLKSSPGGPPSKEAPKGLRGVLEHHFDRLSGTVR